MDEPLFRNYYSTFLICYAVYRLSFCRWFFGLLGVDFYGEVIDRDV